MNKRNESSVSFRLSVTIAKDSDRDLTVLMFIEKNMAVSVAVCVNDFGPEDYHLLEPTILH